MHAEIIIEYGPNNKSYAETRARNDKIPHFWSLIGVIFPFLTESVVWISDISKQPDAERSTRMGPTAYAKTTTRRGWRSNGSNEVCRSDQFAFKNRPEKRMPVGGIFRPPFSGSNAASRVRQSTAYDISLFSKSTFFSRFWSFRIFVWRHLHRFWARSKCTLCRRYFLKSDIFQTDISRELVDRCYKRLP